MTRLGKHLLAVGLTLLGVSLLAGGCDPSGGDLGLFRPDMTWGPASNSLYDTEEDWAERLCKRVHITCQEEPEYYGQCLADWQYGQQVCPVESAALLSCVDALYNCGDYSDWQWWDMVSAACGPEGYQYDMCVYPYDSYY